ncbi:MAG: uracil phosphoribosyltransferase [Cyclobacteriaceae bacterium]
MVFVLTKESSIANHFLAGLRDKTVQKDPERFRKNMERLGELMAYEISKRLEFQQREIQTPLGTAKTQLLSQSPVLVTVLRAGIPFFNGFQNYFNFSEAGFVGAYRQEGSEDITIKLDYLATPSLEGRDLILIDPMLATGKSFIKAAETLAKNGRPRHVYVAAVVAAPEGIAYIESKMKLPFSIFTVAVDNGLNDHAYIVPGLGDAGDLSFGEKR